MPDAAGKHAIDGWNELLVAHLGQAGATVVWTLVSLSAAILGLVFARYVGVLGSGGAAEASAERLAYDKLRTSLTKGGNPSLVYGRLLTAFLDRLDRFLGDHDKADLSGFKNAFGLRSAYPLWTGAALDRCLFLALTYPLLCVFLIWAVSGHAGVVETALGLQSGTPGWRRAVLVVLGSCLTVVVRKTTSTLYLSLFSFLVYGVAIWLLKFDIYLVFSMLFISASLGLALDGSIGGIAGGSAVVAVATDLALLPVFYDLIEHATILSSSYLVHTFLNVAVLIVMAIHVKILDVVQLKFAQHRREGAFVAVFIVTMIGLAICLPFWLAGFPGWNKSGALVLFLGLFTLLNAPFDWLSLGLTRALLRRGIELRGWWPYGLAFADAALATLVVIVLASILIVAVQAFDFASELLGHPPTLQIQNLLSNVALHPSDPGNWWIYALLGSTLIPCLANLLIGSLSLVRGFPGISAILLRFMPEGAAVPLFERAWIAAVLTGQWVLGAALVLAALIILPQLLVRLLPDVGSWVLTYAQLVVAFDLPRQIWSLLAGSV